MADGEILQRLVVEFDADVAKLSSKVDLALARMNGLNRSVHGLGATIDGDLGRALERTFGAGKTRLIDEASARLGGFGQGLEMLGPAGLAAAAGIAAVGASVEQAMKMAEWSEGIERAAKGLGLTTTQLQEFDHVATATGIPIEKMRESLAGLERQIGLVESGLARKIGVKAFTDGLKITPEQLRGWGTLEEQLPHILDAAARLNVEEREGLASRLRVDPEVLNSLIEAREKIRDLITEAHNYGLVVDEDIIRKGAEANEKLKTAGEIISTQLKTAFVDLLPAIVAVANAIGTALRLLGDFAANFQTLQARSTTALHDKLGELQLTRNSPWDRIVPGKQKSDDAQIAAIQAELQGRQDNGVLQAILAQGAPSRQLSSSGGGRKRKVRPDIRQADDVQDVISANAIALEDKLAAARAAGNDTLAQAIEDQETWNKKFQEYKDKLGQSPADAAAHATQFVTMQQAGRALVGARQDIKDLQTPQDFTKTFSDQMDQQAQLLHDTIYQNVRGGLEAAVRGGWPGLAKYMAQTLEEHLVDVLANQLTNLIGNLLSNIGSKGGSSFLSLLGLPGFASGTDYAPGGMALVGENGPELVKLPRGSQVIPNHMLSAPGIAPGLLIHQSAVNITMHSPVVTQDLLDQMDRKANAALQQANAMTLTTARVLRTTIPGELALKASRQFG